MPEPLQPEELFATLARRHVDYVLIGGLAATLHGSSALTNDADICPGSSRDNLDRLTVALRDMDARVRTETDPEGVRASIDADFLHRMNLLTLTTRFGDFDIAFRPAGTQGYEELVQRAVDMDLDGAIVHVAALTDIIRSKETADRPKDRATLPILYALQDEISRQAQN